MADNKNILKKAADAVYPVIDYIKYKKNTFSISPADLFHLQNKGGLFVRPDLIIRYLFIEEYFGENTSHINGIALYKKMQDFRRKNSSGDEMIERFTKVIKSYQQNGHMASHPVEVDRNLFIRDGSHRTAAAMYLGLDEITVHYTEIDLPVAKKLAVFEENGFTDEEKQLVADKTQQLLDRYNQPLQIVLGNIDEDKAMGICRSLTEFGTVTNCGHLSCNKKDSSTLVKKLLKAKDARSSGISIEYDNALYIAEIKLANPEYMEIKSAGAPVLSPSAAMEKLLSEKLADNKPSFFVVPENFGQNHRFREIIESDTNIVRKDISTVNI